MTKQLSLFPDSTLNLIDSLHKDDIAGLETALSPVDEVFAALARFRSSREVMELMQFIARFPNYSTLNGWLLYLQKPAATCVATARTWSQRHNRQLRRGATPLIILAPMAPIRFLFDIRDTEGPPVPSAMLQPREIDDQQLGRLYATTLHNAAIHGIAVCETALDDGDIDSVSRITPALRRKYQDFNLPKDTNYLILIDNTQSLGSRYACLTHELGHIFCNHLGIDRHAWWTERANLDVRGEETEAAAVAYLVCRRSGLQADSNTDLFQVAGVHQEIPPFSLNAVLQAAGYVEDMGKHRWKTPKKGR